MTAPSPPRRRNVKVGSPLPNDPVIERRVIAAPLVSLTGTDAVRDLPADLFYDPAVRAAFEAEQALWSVSPTPLSVELVASELCRQGRDRPDLQELTGWLTEAPYTSQLPGYIAQLRRLHRDRQRITLLAEARMAVDTRDEEGFDRALRLLSEPADRPAGRLPTPVDWAALRDRDRDDEDWLVEDLWPSRRAIAVVADRKKGKSHLMLWVCCCLARGVDPWTGRQRPPVTVAYFDYEMTEDDIHERAFDEFGLAAEDLAGLRYYLLPNLPPLDTPEGGRRVVETVRADGAQVAVFDTFGRAVEGPEDQADTVRAFYTCTALPLKAAGIATARLDHTGHNDKGRARGSSAKADDVDVAWVLTRDNGTGITLDHKGVTRLSWVPRTLSLTYLEQPGRYRRATERWSDGTDECAATLDRLGVPLDATTSAATEALKTAGQPTRRKTIQDALRWRRNPGTAPGTAPREPQTGTA